MDNGLYNQKLKIVSLYKDVLKNLIFLSKINSCYLKLNFFLALEGYA